MSIAASVLISWISIDSELPRDGEVVLVAWGTNQAPRVTACVYRGILDGKPSFQSGGVKVHWITHWARLPATPPMPDLPRSD